MTVQRRGLDEVAGMEESWDKKIPSQFIQGWAESFK